MPGPWTDSQICPNQEFGQHITVRCKGCNSIHSTKNIGWLDEATKEVSLARSLFDILGCFCVCKDTSEHPLVHDCEIDDNLSHEYRGPEDVGLGTKINPANSKHVAKTQKAREVLQSWWVNYAKTKPDLGPLDQETLDELVLLEGEKHGS